MKKHLLFVLVALSVGVCVNVQAGITLDHVDGVGPTEDQLMTDTDVRFHIGLFNDQTLAIHGLVHGFQVYSPDGASWQPITLDTANLGWQGFFDLGVFFSSFSVTGSGADTVGIGAVAAFSGGFPAGFDEVILYIETEVYPDDVGRHLCLDSAWFPPAAAWSWSLSDMTTVIPSWDGPHCWQIGDLPNEPPEITNNPDYLFFDHCDMAYYDFDAMDPEGDPIWFELLSGPGIINPPTGEWIFEPSLDDVGYTHVLAVRACDEFGCGPEAYTEVEFTNEPPVFTSPCPDQITVQAGLSVDYQFTANPVDCDPINFMVMGVDPTPVGTYVIDATGLFTFNTDVTDEGFSYEFVVVVSDGIDEDTCLLQVEVTPHYETLPGVTISQVDFLFDNATQYNSEWGSIEVDVNALLADQGAERLYLNAVVGGEWAIQNLIIDSALADFIKTYFGLRIPPGTDIYELPVDIQITLEPLIEILEGPLFLYPVGSRGFNAEGVSIDGESNDIIPTIMPPGWFDPIGETYEWVWKNLPGENVQAACNQCVPMSVANSLQWLENTYPSITIDDPHVPGLRGDTSLVGQLGEAMERAVVDRAHGNGVSFRKMLQGKLKYLKDNGLENTIVNRHQVDTAIVRRGWLDSATVHLAADSSVSSANETAPNGRVSWDWIYQQIEDGEDVELIYGYYNNAGLRTGGHAVRVFGAGKTNGRPWLMVKHDALQTDDDPGDTLGLQEWFQWVDTLDDGTMTFGSTNQKVDFALSESPADHELTIHFYQLDLYLNDDIMYSNTDWGEVDLTLTPEADTGLVYLNVTVNGSWQVENMPIWPPTTDEGSKTLSIAFDLGVPAGSTITYVNYGYSLTSTTVSGPPAETGITVVADREGILNSGIRDEAVPAPDSAKPAKGGAVADPVKQAHKEKDFPNQDCGLNECCPAAVSNSLKFLNKKHNMGLNDSDLTVAKMRTATNCDADGVWGDHDSTRPAGQRNAWWEDKKKYMEKNKIPVTTRKITDLSKIAAEIAAGQDVELVGGWHVAAVVSITDLGGGKYKLEVKHDTKQGKAGGTKTETIIYDPATKKFTGSPGFFDGSVLDYFIVECPKKEPTPGTNRNSEDGYTPPDGNPIGTIWHELYPVYCTDWVIIDWEDNGDGKLSYCDNVTFVNPATEEISREHIEEVTATITVTRWSDPDSVHYFDFWYGRPDMEPIVPEPGDLWHEVWPDYCTMHEVVYWEDNGTGFLDYCDFIGFLVLTGPDAGTVLDYHVEAFETDVISVPAEDTTCCIPPMRGNIDMDPADQIDISDLVYIVDYMFTGGPAPPCWAEANVDCSDDGDGVEGPEDIDISDLVHLVDYMFNQGPPPCRCDCSDCPQ